jgi:hypothetical protein
MLGEKLLVNPGRFVATVKSALAVPWLPAFEVRVPDTFMCVPGVLLVTLTVTLQVALAMTCPLLKEIVVPPAGAVTTPLVQVVPAAAGVAMVTPAGRTSLKARFMTPVECALLLMTKVSVLTLPGPIVAGEKLLVKVGPPLLKLAGMCERLAAAATEGGALNRFKS